jgi:TfoX/Sxy family transcriptional regulator of competence genes
MPHNPKALQAILQTAAPPDLELAFRPMFGGVMGYAEGKPFASMSDVGLALKMAGADHAELLALRGARPLQYGPDAPPSKSYVKVPETMLEDREALRHWIVRSVAGLARAKPKKTLRAA